MDAEDIRHILELVLLEFPRDRGACAAAGVDNRAGACTPHTRLCHRAVTAGGRSRPENRGHPDSLLVSTRTEYVRRVSVDEVDLGRGCALVTLHMAEDLYYRVISELTGFDIAGEKELIDLLRTLAGMKAEYDKVAAALHDCEDSGYGIVMPDVADMKLDEPEIVRQAGGYGVRLRASASSVHMIRANIRAEVSPIVGTEQQSEDAVRYMLREFEEDPARIWDSNMFGKSLYELVNEGIHAKLEHMPEASRQKLSRNAGAHHQRGQRRGLSAFCFETAKGTPAGAQYFARYGLSVRRCRCCAVLFPVTGTGGAFCATHAKNPAVQSPPDGCRTARVACGQARYTGQATEQSRQETQEKRGYRDSA